MFIETSKNLYESGADIIIDIVGMLGDCYPAKSIHVQCHNVSPYISKIYNKYRPQEHWGHCYVVTSTCYLPKKRNVLVAVCSASVCDSKKTGCYADHERLRSALTELNQWIEDTGHNFSLCIWKFCGARWTYEWDEILQIIEETIGSRTIYLCTGRNPTDPTPDPDYMEKMWGEATKPYYKKLWDYIKSIF